MLDALIHLIEHLGNWGYAILFVAAALESGIFLGLFIPGETVVVTAGFLAAQHALDLDTVITAVALGAVLRDSIGFELGRNLGRPWAEHHGRRLGLSAQRFRKGEAFFMKHGGKAVLLGRFVHFARVLVPFVAGSTHMRYATFVFYNVIGAILWAAAAALLGYFMGQLSELWVGRASAIMGGLVLVAFAFILFGRWLIEHEEQIHDYLARFTQKPLILAFLRQFSPQIAWLQRRLTPGEYFGLKLTVGILIFIGAAWLFGGITQDVIAGDPLTIVDHRLAAWFAAHENPRAVTLMSFISRLHAWPLAGLGFAFLLYLLWKREWRWAVISICVIPGGMLLNAVTKLAVHRPRPMFPEFATAIQTYTFPSGHTMAAVLVYGLLATYMIAHSETWRWRISIALATAFTVCLVAFSRLYLGIHYLSDVLAAMAEGVAWLALCHMAVTTLWLSSDSSRR